MLFNREKKIKELKAEIERLQKALYRANGSAYYYRSEWATCLRMYENAYKKLEDRDREAVLRIAGNLAAIFFEKKCDNDELFVADENNQPKAVPECFVDIARKIVNRADETTPEHYEPSPRNEQSNPSDL